MKLQGYEYPKSSFLGLPKDTAMIMEKILGNQKVLRLLYYTSPDCLKWDKNKDVTSKQVKEMLASKQISNIPKVKIDDEKKTYLRISFDQFTTNAKNEFYRDSIIEIKIISHFDDWDLTDFELRPFRIAGEIDSMLAGKVLSGIGRLVLLSGDQDIYDEEYGGVTLRYLAIRGNEDKEWPLNEQ